MESSASHLQGVAPAREWASGAKKGEGVPLSMLGAPLSMLGAQDSGSPPRAQRGASCRRL